MDVFDGEPYLDLLPRKVMRALGWAAILTLAFVPPARLWLAHQAESHVLHEIQPIFENISHVPEQPAEDGPQRSSE